MGAVGASQSLDRLIGAPAGFQQIVDAPRGIGAAEIGMIAAPGAAGLAEHEDAFLAGHEGGGLFEIGGSRPAAQRQALAGSIANTQHPALPSGDFGDGVMAEVMDDPVQCRLHRGQ